MVLDVNGTWDLPPQAGPARAVSSGVSGRLRRNAGRGSPRRSDLMICYARKITSPVGNRSERRRLVRRSRDPKAVRADRRPQTRTSTRRLGPPAVPGRFYRTVGSSTRGLAFRLGNQLVWPSNHLLPRRPFRRFVPRTPAIADWRASSRPRRRCDAVCGLPPRLVAAAIGESFT